MNGAVPGQPFSMKKLPRALWGTGVRRGSVRTGLGEGYVLSSCVWEASGVV